MQLLWPANHNALSQGPDEQITIYFFWEIGPTQQLFGWQDLIRHIVHFHKFADFGSGKWSCPFLFSLNVWALLHNLSDHRYISCGKIWHHIHHGSNYAEKTKKKENKKRRRSSLTHRYILILTKAFFKVSDFRMLCLRLLSSTIYFRVQLIFALISTSNHLK